MANPVVTSVSFDQPSYAKGAQMVVTCVYSDPDMEALTFTFVVTDANGNQGSGTGNAMIDPSTTQGSSVPARTWTKVSDNGSVAVFTGTA